MIRKLKSGQYRLYSRKKDPKSNKRRNLGTFSSLEAAKKHERAIQYFKHAWDSVWIRLYGIYILYVFAEISMPSLYEVGLRENACSNLNESKM